MHSTTKIVNPSRTNGINLMTSKHLAETANSFPRISMLPGSPLSLYEPSKKLCHHSKVFGKSIKDNDSREKAIVAKVLDILLVGHLNDLYKPWDASDSEERCTYNARVRPATARMAAPKEPKCLEAAPVYGGDEEDPGEPGDLVPDGAMGDPVAEEPGLDPEPPVGAPRPALPVPLANPEEPMTTEELEETLVE